jgi:hypothetical protein
MNRTLQRLRTAPGQLSLLGMVFFCAFILGIVIICLRVPVFERYSRETYLPLDGYAEEASRILADPNSTDEQVAEVDGRLSERINAAANNPQKRKSQFDDLERIFGAWIIDDSFDARGYLVRRLTKLKTDWVFGRLRITLVAGSSSQQARALVWLRSVAGEKSNKERIEVLANYARRKAERRGDRDIFELANAVLAHEGPRDGVP